MEETDSAAVARVKAGDREGFRTLVERHSRSVFRLAYRMTGNEFDAEEVVQETFLRAYRQLDHYELKASFGTWLFRIASNYSLDLLRSKRRHEARRVKDAEDGEETTWMDRVATHTPGPDRMLYSSQVQEQVEKTLAQLTEQERAAFVLRHYEGLSIEEIGSMLDLGSSATKNSIFRAVRKLRLALSPLVEPAQRTAGEV